MTTKIPGLDPFKTAQRHYHLSIDYETGPSTHGGLLASSPFEALTMVSADPDREVIGVRVTEIDRYEQRTYSDDWSARYNHRRLR